VHILLNGSSRDVGDGSTVAELIESLGLSARRVVVERNGEPVERSRFTDIVVEPGDVLEVVRAVQGG
jgi:sulfur carrier protein